MFLIAIFGFATSLFLTYSIRRIASKLKVLDDPDGKRKFHGHAVPLLGGVALFFAFWLPVGYLLYFDPINGILLLKQPLLGAFIGSLVLLLIGIADDIRGLPAALRLVLTIFAILISVLLGVGLQKITNPFGGVIELSSVIGGILVFLWLIGSTYTTKITDGLDGLATGIVLIGSIMIFLLSSSDRFYQPNVATLALIMGGVCLGFLVFNFYPATVFLGESGSMFIGFMLGVLAVISGGKVAVALLAMAIPVFDLLRVIILRKREKAPLFVGDRRHLHYRLVDLGIHPLLVVLGYYSLAVIFGFSALFLPSAAKLGVVIILGLLILLSDVFLPKKKTL